MKLQYLGDSKDSFKWDYHDFLVQELQLPILNIVLMLTPDDRSNDGKTLPTKFPARQPVIDFCKEIRQEYLRCKQEFDISILESLPSRTTANYSLGIHKKESGFFSNGIRNQYFSGFSTADDQLLLLDPDTGFEPRNSSKKHVLYSDISSICNQISEKSVISVFQHSRRQCFTDHFADIKQRLDSRFVTAIYWRDLMFVAMAKSQGLIGQVREANEKYLRDGEKRGQVHAIN
ncbi:MAG: hypothetical protein C4520_04170 [Candidatus Abyssobacteria bacterium SURF_5]|uniref:Uncharacterized protein n=1 Tax=Abyssobacteria bacterium (strain SURF_5) TaxID=2093360 RepID=A0A3A4P1R7_ABYX5|nr:MAG: hypothetical protein C4520_04170 [Candidatus Abyssubacteria bacterium SURF_5]